MKRLLSFLLAALFCLGLSACGETVPESSPTPTPQSTPEAPPENTPELIPAPKGLAFSFTRENLPRLDGSTSLVPLAQAACASLLGESLESVEDLTRFNRTTQSYRNLMNGQAEVLIASWPAQTVFDEMEAADFAYEMAPIATDALIFVVNENNPVDSLTTEQLIGIYTGEISNWSEVGGRDEPIAAFQRNAGAGSQALMEKLVMKDTPMMTPPTELMAGSMGELMEYVKSYDNSGNALGYSVYYYANDMRMADGLKIIAVDGVEPTAESIRAGEYPHLSNYYTVIAAAAAADSPARILYDWLQSPDGQRLVEQEGYVPALDVSDAESFLTAGGYNVSAYGIARPEGEAEGAVYTRLSEEWIDGLAAGEDYGALHPFVGTYNYDDYGQKMPVYGLFDAAGRIVCDPVYTGVERMSYYENGVARDVPLLKLSRGDSHTIVSPDGSFVSPESYRYVRVLDFGVLCARDFDSTDFVLYDFDGKVLMTQDDLQLNGAQLNSASDIYGGQKGQLLVWLEQNGDTAAWLMDLDGTLLRGGWYSADFMGDGWLEVHTEESDYTGLMDQEGKWIIRPIYRYILPLGEERFAARDGDVFHIFDRSGKMLMENIDQLSQTPYGWRCGDEYYLSDGTKLALEGTWENSFYTVACPIVYQANSEHGTTTLRNVYSGKTLELAGECMVEQVFSNFVMGLYSDLPYVIVWQAGPQATAPKLVSWDLEQIYEFPETVGVGLGAFPVLRDGFTGEEYLQVSNGDHDSGPNALYSPDMELLAPRGSYTQVWNGLLVNTDEQFCTYTDFNGQVVFRYPLTLGGGD